MSAVLERIHVTGFCSLADVTLEPGRLTVLIGANGSGKTNILKALTMIALMRTASLQRFVGEAGGASSLLHYGPKTTKEITVELDFDRGAERNGYKARLGFAGGDRLIYLEESASYRRSADSRTQTFDLGVGHLESEIQSLAPVDMTAKTVNFLLARLTFFHFHDTSMTSSLRTNSRLEDDRHLRSDGSNLASFLYRLEQSGEEAERKAWARINKLVRRVAPSVKALRPTPTSNGNVSLRLDWVDDRDELFGAHQLSDGTLRAIALITALAQPADHLPLLISIDEPELGLHPAAISLLAELARSVSRHTQIIFATQSTAFLDYFRPDEVVVVEREHGATALKRLDEDALQDWLEEYTLSEVFEKGVIGGRP